MRTYFIAIPLCFALCCAVMSGQEKFNWQSVTHDDWSIVRDTSKEMRDAVMLFEKVTADDTKLMDEECYLRVYRRVKILSSKGKSWADVKLPYDPERSDIKTVMGRTLLPEGTILELSKDRILEKEIVKTENMKVREKFFSLPGVTEGCIIEYYFEYQNKKSNPVWVTQKEIPLLHWEYRWKFFESGISNLPSFLMPLEYSFGISPNYLWLNGPPQMKIDMLPSDKEPHEALFSATDLPAFHPEPFCLPDEALKIQLRSYYGSGANPLWYWGLVAFRLKRDIDRFISNRGNIRQIVKDLSKITTKETRITAAYNWVQQHIKNTNLMGSERKYDKNESVDDVVDHQYGSHEEINFVFHSLLAELNIPSSFLFVADRQQHIFYDLAKYWQFDHSVVVVKDSGGSADYYSPGSPGEVPKQVPWFYEGTTGLAVDLNGKESFFVEVPMSKSSQNEMHRNMDIELGSDYRLRGKVQEEYSGHEATRLRLLLQDIAPSDRANLLKKEISESLSSDWKDSIQVSAVDDTNGIFVCKYQLVGPTLELDANNRILFRPFSFFAYADNPFVAETRKYPLMFKYATAKTETLSLKVGRQFSLDELPSPLTFSNITGEVECKVTRAGDTLQIGAGFILNQPLLAANMYNNVKALYDQWLGLRDVTIILKKMN